jgi:hypothetical protein
VQTTACLSPGYELFFSRPLQPSMDPTRHVERPTDGHKV